MWLSGLSRAERKTVSINTRTNAKKVSMTMKRSSSWFTSQIQLEGFDSGQVGFHTGPNGSCIAKVPKKRFAFTFAYQWTCQTRSYEEQEIKNCF